MTISAAAVKALRERTGAGMMDCKRALTEAEGDEAKAIRILREKGIASAAKKASRAANEGMISEYLSDDRSVGVLAEINCETDFVARTPQFQEMVARITKHIATVSPSPDCVSLETSPAGKAPLLDQPLADNPSVTVGDLLKSTIGELGENMLVSRFAHFQGGVTYTYIHPGSRIGSMIQIEASAAVTAKPEFAQLARDLAMQVAGHLPPVRCIRREELSPEEIQNEKEVYMQQGRNEGKPEAILEKIVEGKLSAFYKQVCLLEQVYIKDTSTTVQKLLKAQSDALGGPIQVKAIARYQVGEGL